MVVSQRWLQGGYHDWQSLSSFIFKEEPNFSDLGQSLGFEFCKLSADENIFKRFKSSDLLMARRSQIYFLLTDRSQTFLVEQTARARL